jgi:leucyl/phenylalanyl-tRNA--protein transferase
VFRLDDRLIFPPPHLADDNGLLAVGGDLSPERLLLAYSQGIFPWYEEGLPILWHSPDPRMVVESDEVIVNRSLRKAIRKQPYRISCDEAFADVIAECAKKKREGQRGTWITTDMQDAYIELHERGFAHSVEAWLDDELVGGLYGVSLGGVFCGESMFAHRPDASKIAFAILAEQLVRWNIGLIDCQVHTEHLERFGAHEIPRAEFLQRLEKALELPTRRQKWTLDEDLLANSP